MSEIVYNIGYSTDEHPADPEQLRPRKLRISEILREIGDTKIRHVIVKDQIPLDLIEKHCNLLSLEISMKLDEAIIPMRKIFRCVNLKNLEKLVLCSNQLTDEHFPKTAFEFMPSLRELDLSHNKLQLNCFNHMSALRILDISHNTECSVDRIDFSPFSSLEELNISGCIFDKVPESFKQLKNLTKLVMNGCTFNEVKVHSVLHTTGIGVSLKEIDIGKCGLSEVPDLDCCRVLIRLNLADNPFEMRKEVDSSFKLLGATVHELNLFNCRMKSLPKHILISMNLYKLDIGKNRLNSLPDGTFDNLRSLKELQIADCALSFLPQSLRALTELKVLDISENPLEEDLAENMFSPLKKLKDLDISDCGISIGHLPKSLRRLRAAKVITGGNELDTKLVDFRYNLFPDLEDGSSAVTCILFSHSHKTSKVETDHMMVVASGHVPCVMDHTVLHRDDHAMQVSTVHIRNDKLASLSNNGKQHSGNIPLHFAIAWTEDVVALNDILYNGNHIAVPHEANTSIEYNHKSMKIIISTNREKPCINFSVVEADDVKLCDIDDSFMTMLDDCADSDDEFPFDELDRPSDDAIVTVVTLESKDRDSPSLTLYHLIAGEIEEKIRYPEEKWSVYQFTINNSVLYNEICEKFKKGLLSILSSMQDPCRYKAMLNESHCFVVTEMPPVLTEKDGVQLNDIKPRQLEEENAFTFEHPVNPDMFIKVYEPQSPIFTEYTPPLSQPISINKGSPVTPDCGPGKSANGDKAAQTLTTSDAHTIADIIVPVKPPTNATAAQTTYDVNAVNAAKTTPDVNANNDETRATCAPSTSCATTRPKLKSTVTPKKYNMTDGKRMQNVLATEQQQFINKLNEYHDSEGNIEHVVTMIICSKMENSRAEPETQVFMIGAIAIGNTFPNRIECRGTSGFSITTQWLINSTLSDGLRKRVKPRQEEMKPEQEKVKQKNVKLRYALVPNHRLWPSEEEAEEKEDGEEDWAEWAANNLQYPTDVNEQSSSIDSHSMSMKSGAYITIWNSGVSRVEKSRVKH